MLNRSDIDRIRNTKPADPEHLRLWLRLFLGLRVADRPVCRGHSTPWDIFREWYFDNPLLCLVHGPRGGGKSFLSGLDTHLRSRFNPGYGTRILAGSKDQSRQTYDAIRTGVQEARGELGSDSGSIRRLLKGEAEYANGSRIEILAASPTSVRGPHVPSLKLDEIEEIDPEVRDAAVNIASGHKGSHKASILMTSTWHRVGGPMQDMVDLARGRNGFPHHTFCSFEVLETCPEERSGPGLEKCPECPIVAYCHEDKEDFGGLPKAKRSDGHLTIDGLIQKATILSKRAFEADNLCRGAKADGLWFPNFDRNRHVHSEAEYDPRWPTHLALDSGVFTGAVFYQIRERMDAGVPTQTISVFADYLSEGQTPYTNAQAIMEIARTRCNGIGTVRRRWTDPAGKARNAIGPTVIGEYAAAGLTLEPWPVAGVTDGLSLIEGFVEAADGKSRLILHPRCVNLIGAFESYRRAKVSGQWRDYPADPQHPAEDLMDALRGGLKAYFPEGRMPRPVFKGRSVAGTLY